MSTDYQIRERVLRAFTLNRTPGYHFVGNFLDFSFDLVTEPQVCMAMDDGAHIADAHGNVHYGAAAVFVDMAMAANIRAGHFPYSRLATVQMNLQFTGTPMRGRLELDSRLQGYIDNITSRQGAAQVTLTAQGNPVCFGYGTFMVLDPPKGVALYNMSLPKHGDPPVAPMAESELNREERLVLNRVDAALAAAKQSGTFIDHFWGIETHAVTQGASGSIKNGPHIGNRVGHVQGGMTMALGIATAEKALPPTWMLSAVTAWYISPGEGRVIKAKSKIIHHGRLTSVVRTELTGKNKRRVMEMITTHAHKSA